MTSFHVLNWEFNSKKVERYDIMPYLVEQYKKSKEKPKSYEEIKAFIIREGKYMWWSRCQYEIIISSWPHDKEPLKHCVKIDVWDQIEMNLDTVIEVFKKNIEK